MTEDYPHELVNDIIERFKLTDRWNYYYFCPVNLMVKLDGLYRAEELRRFADALDEFTTRYKP